MIRNISLFLTAVLLGLTAGRAFWVSLGEHPFTMSGRTYVEFFQQLDARIAIPIAITGIGGTLMAGLSAVLHRTDLRASGANAAATDRPLDVGSHPGIASRRGRSSGLAVTCSRHTSDSSWR
jgi:hypothetical protein